VKKLGLIRHLVIGLCLTGCGTTLSAAGQAVHMGKAPPHENCRELGIVYGSGGGGAYTSTESKVEGANNDLRNKTAEMGGNFVVLDTSNSDVTGITISGRAFQCGEPPKQKPVPVTVTNQTSAQQPANPATAKETAPQPQKSPEERMRELQNLLEKGLITQEEFDQRRKQILDSI
jgi:hypothetical protein